MPDRRQQGQAEKPGAPFTVEYVQGGWRVRADVEIRGGTPVIVGLHVEPARKMPVGGVTSRVTRSVNFTALNKAIADHLAVATPSSDHDDDPVMKTRRPGRRGYPAAYYAIWADRYVKVCETGVREPYAVLAEKYPDDTDRDVRTKYIHRTCDRASDLGLLKRSGSQGGVAGGRLTVAGRKALAGLRIGLVHGKPQQNQPTRRGAAQ